MKVILKQHHKLMLEVETQLLIPVQSITTSHQQFSGSKGHMLVIVFV